MAITNATTLADYAAGISTQNATLKVDSGNKRVGIGTTNPKQTLQVGTAVSVYGNAGIVSATSFYGDGANLTNVGVDTGTLVSDQVFVVGVATVGSAVTINSTGIDAISGVITASSFVGDGSNITGLANTDFINATQLNVIGVATASSFVGNVTGNASGTAGGLTGTPDITIRNITGVAATFTGVLTYEDVTNVDSVGIVTARGGLEVGAAGVGGTVSALGHVEFVGVTTIGLGLTLTDNIKAKFGNSGDLSIYHDGSNSYIANDTGVLNIQGGGANIQLQAVDGESGVIVKADDAVELYFNGSKKLTTVTTGINPSADSTDDLGTSAIRWRNIYGDTLYGDGSNLTNLPAAGITTTAGTASGIVTTLLLNSAQDHKVTATGFCTITCSGGTEGESHSVRIINSGIATVGFSTYFLFPSGSAPVLPTADTSISLISFTVNRVGLGGTQLLAGASLNFS